MNKMIRWLEELGKYICKNPLEMVIILLFLVAIAKISSLYLSVDNDDGHWNQFKVEHNCVEQPSQGTSPNGGWLCDDGEVHYRWRQQR
ncbi:MAG: hypothetical protein V3V31_07080 [Methylococcales bacterium]